LDACGHPGGAGEKKLTILYIPAIGQVRKGLGKRGLLYVGDSKLMSLGNRAYIQAGGDYYLGPFSKVEIPDEDMDIHLRPVWSGEQALTPVYRTNTDGEEEEEIAEGLNKKKDLTAMVNGEELVWIERRLFVRSFMYAKASETALRERLDQAQAALEALNERKAGQATLPGNLPLASGCRRDRTPIPGRRAAEFELTEQVQERNVHQYGDRPTEVRIECRSYPGVSRNETAIEQAGAILAGEYMGQTTRQNICPCRKRFWLIGTEYLVERALPV